MAEKRHNFTRTEIKAGIFVLASLVVFGVFVAAILGLRPPRPTKTYYADFVNAKGIGRGSPVYFGGLQVGKVEEVGLLADHPSLVRIKATVNADVPVNRESRAQIAQLTLTSENHLAITTGSDRAELMPDGAIITSEEGGIFDVAGLVAQDVRELLGDIRTLLGAEGQPAEDFVTIEDLFRNVKIAVNEGTGAVQDVRRIVADNREAFDAILGKVQEIEESTDKLVKDINAVVTDNRPAIDESVENVRKATASAAEAVARVSEATRRLDGLADTLESALASASKAGGSAAAFIEKARPALEEIILDIRETVWHLKGFARTIEEQPESVLRGATPQGRKP
jgi:phospholipid/cholesterol/gamma-HCH transport system substrate-binding protein